MKKNTLIICLLFMSFYNVNAQSNSSDNQTNHSDEFDSKLRPFIALSIFPLPTALLAGQLSIGITKEKRKTESSIYLKAGIALESYYHSLFIENAFQIKKITLKNQNELNFQIPLWIAYRNYRPLARGEEHYSTAYFTMLNAGTGLNIKHDVRKRISLVGKIGVGIGPKYIKAGDYKFDNFEYQGIVAFPNLDFAFVFWL